MGKQHWPQVGTSPGDEMLPRKLLRIISFESLFQGNTKHEPRKEASGLVRSLQSSAGKQITSILGEEIISN